MNFGYAHLQLVDFGRCIRRKSWNDGVTLGLNNSVLVWLEDGSTKMEPVSCLPASELMADDWEVVP